MGLDTIASRRNAADKSTRREEIRIMERQELAYPGVRALKRGGIVAGLGVAIAGTAAAAGGIVSWPGIGIDPGTVDFLTQKVASNIIVGGMYIAGLGVLGISYGIARIEIPRLVNYARPRLQPMMTSAHGRIPAFGANALVSIRRGRIPAGGD